MIKRKKFLAAIGRSERLKLDGSFLLIYTNGSDQRLRFTQLNDKPINADLTQLFSRIWQTQDRAQNIYTFLPNGTMLQTSCKTSCAIATWTIDNNAPTILKVQQNPKRQFTLEIKELTDTNLRSQMRSSSNRIENINLTAITQALTCLN